MVSDDAFIYSKGHVKPPKIGEARYFGDVNRTNESF
jgi:hypothetical protein